MSLASCTKYNRNLFQKVCKKIFTCQNKREFRCVSRTVEKNPVILKNKCFSRALLHRLLSSNANASEFSDCAAIKSDLFIFHHDWPEDVKNEFIDDMVVIENFISEEEESRLCAEAEKTMKRMRYQYDHWDDAIHGYREMEKTNWWPENEGIFNRIRSKAFVADVLPHVHILDLAADGIIKPHVDSSRYCGSTIAGVSLLTDCIMRMKRIDEKKYEQERIGEAPNNKDEIVYREFDYFADVLLRRRSLYIMKDSARYNFTHEVLPTKSTFMNKEVVKDRRISIICRNQA